MVSHGMPLYTMGYMYILIVTFGPTQNSATIVLLRDDTAHWNKSKYIHVMPCYCMLYRGVRKLFPRGGNFSQEGGDP